MLPLALEVRAKVDKMLEVVWGVATEAHVRERVRAINAEIARANRTTATGPPTTLAPLDIEDILAEWRRRRPSRTPNAEEAR